MCSERTDSRVVLGVRVDPVDRASVFAALEGYLQSDGGHSIHLCPAYNLVLGSKEPDYAAILNRGCLNVPDGYGAVWGGRALGARIPERFAGTDFCRAVFAWGVPRGVKHFFYGGTDDVLAKLHGRLADEFPGIQIAGSYSPPFRALTDEEESSIVRSINASGAHIVWVGIGTPKQDQWIDRLAGMLDAKVSVAVGAAFDFLAGEKKRAPVWMQRIWLEWLHRLLSEPRRLWKRYLVGNTVFVVRLMRQVVAERILRGAAR